MPFSKRVFGRGLLLSAALVSAAIGAAPAQAWTFKVLHSFCAKQNCLDGGVPGPLVIDPSGNFFGIATYGGRRAGTLFELSPLAGGQWQYQVLYSPRQNSTAPLIMDTAGNLYSSTFNLGKNAAGSIYELVRPRPGGHWRLKTLYNFCQVDGPVNCLDGRYTQTGLTYAGQASGAPYDGVSPLYGSTYDGGGANFPGVVFRLLRNDAGHWRYKVIYTFCSQSNCSDGMHPGRDGVIADRSGDLFGATRTGGANSSGTVFALRTASRARHWREETLHAFCSQPNCADGSWGSGGLLLMSGGSLIGVTANGGNSCTQSSTGCGVLFRADRATAGSYQVLHAFCSDANCTDGAGALPGVIENRKGTLFGVTANGGGNTIDENGQGGGVVYAFSLSSQSLQVLHAFCAQSACADGEYPAGRLAMDSAGNLFGTTQLGGEHGFGVIYELSP